MLDMGLRVCTCLMQCCWLALEKNPLLSILVMIEPLLCLSREISFYLCLCIFEVFMARKQKFDSPLAKFGKVIIVYGLYILYSITFRKYSLYGDY